MNTTFCLWLSLLATIGTASAADRPASNLPLVRSSTYGHFYARSIPAQRYGREGRTAVYRVGADADTLLAEFDWYAQEFYIGGSLAEPVIVRFDHSPNGRHLAPGHLALGIYRGGQTLREYTTVEMHEKGSGVTHSVSSHHVFRQRLGFQQLDDNRLIYRVEGVSGKVFAFDLTTGEVVEEPAAQHEYVDYMRIALDAIDGKVRLQPDAPVELALDGDHAIVTFGWLPPTSTTRGPDFTARVTIDRHSKAVIKILGG